MEKSRNTINSLWTIKAQSEHNLRDRGISLDYKVYSLEWINNLPDIKQARLWNSQNQDVTFLNAKPGSYIVKSKFEFLLEYFNKLDDNSKLIVKKFNADQYIILEQKSPDTPTDLHMGTGGHGIQHHKEVKHHN